MKYYIDFEATQFEQEIISVGCVSENGDGFYALVKPHSLRKVTGFITELTGISAKSLTDEASADEVFSRMYDTIDKTERVNFLCYGNCDINFVRSTLKYVKSFKAQCMLGLILSSLKDVSIEISVAFGTDQTISLYKLADYYGAPQDKNHNAENDARILKHVYESFKNDTVVDCPFPEYVNPKRSEEDAAPRRKYKLTARSDKGLLEFSSYSKAADWIMTKKLPVGSAVTENTKGQICNRISKAVRTGNPYFGCFWYEG